MEIKEKLALLEEIMELDEDTLSPETILLSTGKWDSMVKLSFIVILDECFNKNITANEIKEFKTINDMLEVMQCLKEI